MHLVVPLEIEGRGREKETFLFDAWKGRGFGLVVAIVVVVVVVVLALDGEKKSCFFLLISCRMFAVSRLSMPVSRCSFVCLLAPSSIDLLARIHGNGFDILPRPL